MKLNEALEFAKQDISTRNLNEPYWKGVSSGVEDVQEMLAEYKEI